MNSYISKLRSQPINLLAVVAILSIIVIGWSIYAIIWIDGEMGDIVQRTEEKAELQETLGLLLKQEVAEQQYLLGGDLAALIQHKQFETLADFHLDQAYRFQSTREEMALITEIRNDRDSYEAVFAQNVAHYDNGEVEEAVRMSFNEAQVFRQHAQEQVEAFVARVEQEQEGQMGRTDQLAWISLIMSLVLLGVFVGIAYIAFSINNRVLKSILLLAVVISLIIVGWNIYNIWHLKGEVRSVVTHLDELDQIELTEIYLLDQEIAELKYLLSGDEAYVKRHRKLEATTDEHWRLVISLQTTAEEQNLLSALKQDHDVYEQTFATIVTTYQQGDRAEAVRLSVEKARISLDDVQRRVDDFITQMELQLEEELAQVDRLTPVALTIGAFTLIILMMEAVISTTATVRVEIQQLRVQIDEIKRQKEVKEIVETEFFHDLQARAEEMRHRKRNRE